MSAVITQRSKQEKKTILREARIMIFLYILILSICIFYNFWAPLWYWWLPVMLGEPVMRAIRLTEHVGRPNTDDLKENNRENKIIREKMYDTIQGNINSRRV